jgi:predicted glycoside hydrolase/deacetylase ChbG (UPF0249 family)
VAKYLIVNADDLGMARSTNFAIRRAFQDGIVSSASLMANMTAFQHAVDQVVDQHPGLGIGIHLCLTSGKPVLPPGEVPLLVDGRGEFCHGFFGLRRLLGSRRREAAVAQIAAELRAQAEKFDACGLHVDHVDGHQHVQMIPEIFTIAAALASVRQAAIRISNEQFRGGHRSVRRWLAWLANGGVIKKMILSRLAQSVLASEAKLFRADHYYGVLETGRMTVEILWEILDSLPDGISEINCHPGLPGLPDPKIVCSRPDRRFLASLNRCRELAALLDPSFHGDLLGAGITLARFQDLLPRRHAPWTEPLRKAA